MNERQWFHFAKQGLIDPMRDTLVSFFETDNEGHPESRRVNVVDGLYLIGNGLHRIADALERHNRASGIEDDVL